MGTTSGGLAGTPPERGVQWARGGGLFDCLSDLLGREGLLGGDPDLARGEVDLDICDALDGRQFLGH